MAAVSQLEYKLEEDEETEDEGVEEIGDEEGCPGI